MNAPGAVELRVEEEPRLRTALPVQLLVVHGTLSGMAGVGIPNVPEEFPLRRNDTLPPYQVDVLDEDGLPVDLSANLGVLFTMVAADGVAKIDRVAGTLVVGSDGSTVNRLRYDWIAGDTDTSGRYLAEFEVSFAGGLKRTFPASRRQKLVVVIGDDLDAT